MQGYFLHHGFVATLLTDLFGIQSSTACMGDSLHSQELLGIDAKLAKKYDQQLTPGFTTISLSYATTQTEVTFIIQAIKLCANQGWKLLPFYEMDRKTGIFRFSGKMVSSHLIKLYIYSIFNTVILFVLYIL